MVDLERIYRETLGACAPDHLVERVATRDMPANVAAIGKSAAALLDGFARVVAITNAIAAIPRGYPAPRTPCSVHFGGHPDIDDGSFRAGRALLDFVSRHDEVTFLVSGGGSACADVPLEPFFTEADVTRANHRLITAGIGIAEINLVRRHLSGLKGGRLAAAVKGSSVSLIYSDVATGDLASVASGLTIASPGRRDEAIGILERIGGCHEIVAKLRDLSGDGTVEHLARTKAILVADNTTLTATAADVIERGGSSAVRSGAQIETDVVVAARELAARALRLRTGEVLVAGGEPTVRVLGEGKGGRCLELAVRFAMEMNESPTTFRALFGSSDGVDGNSGTAGVVVDLPARMDRPRVEELLAASESRAAAAEIGRPIIIPATGNNLRDLYLVARTPQVPP